MAQQLFNYQAKILRIVDGDTVDLQVDLGFKVSIDIRVRLTEINAPELSTPEGVKSKEWLERKIEPNQSVIVSTFKNPGDPYGRWLGKITTEQFGDLSSYILKEGYAVPFKQSRKK
jgi:micrococcal nuclease